MTLPLLLADLRRDEGLSLHAYPDPKSGGTPWTIGYGHTGPAVRPGQVCTLQEAEAWLEADLAGAETQLTKAIPWWVHLDDVRHDALAELGFNLGVHKLVSQFPDTIGAICAGDYAKAGADLAADQWARDVGPARSGRIVAMLKTGRRPGAAP